MEVAITFLQLLIYFLLAVLIIISIVLVVKLLGTVDKANVLLDDLQKKSDSLNGVFGAVNSITNAFGSFNLRMVSSFANMAEKVYSLFGRKKKDKEEDYEEEEEEEEDE